MGAGRRGVRRPARIYDLRSTFASDPLAAGVSVFALARLMDTSVKMIERHYGTLIDGAAADVADRLDALDAARNSAREERFGHELATSSQDAPASGSEKAPLCGAVLCVELDRPNPGDVATVGHLTVPVLRAP
jgi:hypothetical protein